jgi:fused signal recognition particle receptor
VLVVGVNGSGKTTTIGKLASRLTGEGRTVSLAGADTFRAAASEQLTVWADRAGAHLVSQQRGADPASVAFDAVRSATARGSDVLIVDTAGRLHTQVNLMKELDKIKRVLAKKIEGAPHEVLLVLDANTGQNTVAQVKAFDDALGLTGLIITKLDGTAKGGAICAIAKERPVPVLFIGVGEGIDDLRPFVAREFAEALIG